jgi:Flp pilus assembly protein TadG
MIRRTGSAREEGQILVIFAVALIALIGFAGLAIDGGGTFAQRRDQQTASDLAALAGANDYLINGSTSLATARARDVSEANGFTTGINGTTVTVGIDQTNGVAVTVSINSPHKNAMARVFGMNTWLVSTTATALAGFPDTGKGVGPFIFSAHAFQTDGTPMYTTPTAFGETNGDVPTSAVDLAWTNWGTGNVNTSEVSAIIDGSSLINKTLTFGEYIGQHNSGNHTTLFDDVNTYLSSRDMPVAVVDDNGNFAGWAMFHVISADSGSSKHVYGYFLSTFVSAQLGITACSNNACPRYLGAYVLKLTN